MVVLTVIYRQPPAGTGTGSPWRASINAACASDWLGDSYIEPQVILDTILVTVDKHLRTARTLTERKRSMQSEIEECVRFASFLGTLDSLFKQPHTPPNLDVIMLTIKDQTAVEHIRSTIAKLTDGKFKLFTVPAGRGTLAGMITLEKDASVAVSAALTREHVPELALPPSFEALPLSGKITYLERQGLELSRQIEAVDRELGDLGRRWGPIYRRVREWIRRAHHTPDGHRIDPPDEADRQRPPPGAADT